MIFQRIIRKGRNYTFVKCGPCILRCKRESVDAPQFAASPSTVRKWLQRRLSRRFEKWRLTRKYERIRVSHQKFDGVDVYTQREIYIKESRWKRPPNEFLFPIKRNYERKKAVARFQENYRCTSSRNVLCIVCTAKQRAKTLTTISLTSRSLGFKLDQRTTTPRFVSPEIWWRKKLREGNHKFFKFRPLGFPLPASS